MWSALSWETVPTQRIEQYVVSTKRCFENTSVLNEKKLVLKFLNSQLILYLTIIVHLFTVSAKLCVLLA